MISTENRGRAGVITLDRPKALNAVTLEMVRELDAVLRAWESDDAVQLVIIRGAGDRAFCAGGDVASLYANAKAGEAASNEVFFAEEYQLNGYIAEYPKPYVALMDGIALGGGVGLSAHGSHRIVTETTRLGMPEVGIGLFPDVGASWLLARSPHHLGRHLALTGAHAGAADAITAGLADTFVPRDKLEQLVDALSAGDPSVIADFAGQAPDGLDADPAELERAYGADTVADVLENLHDLDREWAGRAAAAIERSCPTSVKVALEAQRRAADMSLAEVLAQDLRLAKNIGRRADFVEGVRAQIIDKDRTPHWEPATLADVPDHAVTELFEGA